MFGQVVCRHRDESRAVLASHKAMSCSSDIAGDVADRSLSGLCLEIVVYEVHRVPTYLIIQVSDK